MHHFFVEPSWIGKDIITIEGSDVNHIRNVLRMKAGDELHISSGEDNRDYRCCIERVEEDKVTARIMWVNDSEAELPSRITLFQGLPKSDKMELIIQKAVELGAWTVVPVAMRRSVVKLNAAKAQAKVKRWNAISESAAAQSKRMHIPEVRDVASFGDALKEASSLDVILLPYELAEDMCHTREVLGEIRPGQSVGVFIGPEGGFDPEEARLLEEAGARVITLGRRILRTETAGMAVLSMLVLMLEGKT